MKNIFLVFILFLITSSSVFAQKSDSTLMFDPARNPFEDLKVAVSAATE